jgi:hypothetical protein
MWLLRIGLRLGVAVLTSVALTGCSESTGPSTNATATFLVETASETFVVRVATSAQAQALRARMASGQRGVISGELRAGDGGFNMPRTWHLDPASVDTPDIAIELCDGRPSYVDADRSYWLNAVKRFCPWGAKVVSEVTN